jgi:hypothetical protein
MTTRAGRCCAIWASRSGRTEKEETHGQDSAQSEAGPQAEVPGPRVYPMPEMRPTQGGVSQVRVVSYLSTRDGTQGRASWDHEEFLVMDGFRRSSALLPGEPRGLRRLRPGARPIHVRKAAPKQDEDVVTPLCDAGGSEAPRSPLRSRSGNGNHSEKEDHPNS